MNPPADKQVEALKEAAPEREVAEALKKAQGEIENSPPEEDSSNAAEGPNVQQPEFSDVPVSASETGTAMEHLQDVPVEVSAELGRVSMTIGELLRIGEGAVIKLNRQISAPVELVAQGVRVAMADVVVVDDCFAVRIRSVERSR